MVKEKKMKVFIPVQTTSFTYCVDTKRVCVRATGVSEMQECVFEREKVLSWQI